MKTIALACPSTSGNHQTCVRTFARTLLELGHREVALTPGSGDPYLRAQHTFPGLTERLTVVELHHRGVPSVRGPLSGFFGKLAWVQVAARPVREAGCSTAWFLTPGSPIGSR